VVLDIPPELDAPNVETVESERVDKNDDDDDADWVAVPDLDVEADEIIDLVVGLELEPGLVNEPPSVE
jgi:hypothetical protein